MVSLSVTFAYILIARSGHFQSMAVIYNLGPNFPISTARKKLFWQSRPKARAANGLP